MGPLGAVAGGIAKAVFGAVKIIGSLAASGAGKLASSAGSLLGGAAKAGFAAAPFASSGSALAASAVPAASLTAAGGGFLAGAGPTLLGGAIGAGIGGSKGGLKGALTGGLLGAGAGSFAGKFASGFGGAASGSTLGQRLAAGGKALFSSQGALGTKGGFSLGSLGESALKKIGIPLGAAGLAGAFGPKPQTSFGYDPIDSYKNIRTYVGDQSLKLGTNAELSSMVRTPIAELAKSYNFGNDRTMRKLNEAFDKQVADIQRSASQMGQSALNSSDVRNRIDEINRNRATAIAETEQELANFATVQAIQAKQSALGNALQQNQFDDELAFELADLVGQKEALEFAIRQGDVEQFQNIMAQILQIGLGYEGAGAAAGI